MTPAIDPLDTSDREKLSVREVAERFIEVFYNQNRLTDAFRAWVHPDYIQHDPNAPNGRDGTIAVLAEHTARNPQMSHEVKRVIHGEGGMVAVHYHFRRAPDDRGAIDWAKISAVERARRVRRDQEELILAQAMATGPARQRPI